jgi:hypothetical protein
VISSGVSAPLTASHAEEAGRGLVAVAQSVGVVAQSVGDDGGGQLEQLLPDGGEAGGGGPDTDLAQECGQVVRTAQLACQAARGLASGIRSPAIRHVSAVGRRLWRDVSFRCTGSGPGRTRLVADVTGLQYDQGQRRG